MKKYMNDAITGDGQMLACFDNRGELIRLYAPHPDAPQHVEQFFVGLHCPEKGTVWLHEDGWQVKQRYLHDTNIIETDYLHHGWGVRVLAHDFVLPKHGTLVRTFDITYLAEGAITLHFIAYSEMVSTEQNLTSSLYDHDAGGIVHYRPDQYVAVVGQDKPFGFQITDGAMGAAQTANFHGVNDFGMIGQASQGWQLGTLAQNMQATFTLHICYDHTLKGVLQMAQQLKSVAAKLHMHQTKAYWHAYLSMGKPCKSGHPNLDTMYRRSLLVFALMSDAESGGILAAPEVDEQFSTCGRYGYCWGRDAGFITTAMDEAGYYDMVDNFFAWAKKAQASNGSWYQRYTLDGQIAPSWGLQIDETGTLIWGIFKHYQKVKRKLFLTGLWQTVKSGADFLMHFMDENGLPKPTYDLWEERIGQHTYSAAAVCAGLLAAVEIATVLKKDSTQWRVVANALQEKIASTLWHDEQGRFVRAVNAEVKGEGYGGWLEVAVNDMGYKKWVTAYDMTVDICILGLAQPFGIIAPTDERMLKTVQAIRKRLIQDQVGGIRRYEEDDYRGGNPWILTSLWLALYDLEIGNKQTAKEILKWSAKHQTYMGLLPEQVDRQTGDPAWVVPLTWSHAMFVLVYLRLFGE
ncbi:MAG: glycoside hydrolase [Hyphomonadaceae bacterium]|nr:glycoside hydrolase [Clostridia bacterium]